MNLRKYDKKKIENTIITYGKENEYVLPVYLYLYMNSNIEGKIQTTIEDIAREIDISVNRKNKNQVVKVREALAILMKDNEDFSQVIVINRGNKDVVIDTYNSRNGVKGGYRDDYSRCINTKIDNIRNVKQYNKEINVSGIYELTREEILDAKRIKDKDTIVIYFLYENADVTNNFTFLDFYEYNYLTNIISWYKMKMDKSYDLVLLTNVYMYIKMNYCRVNNMFKKNNQDEKKKFVQLSLKTISKYVNASESTCLIYVKLLVECGMLQLIKGVFEPTGNGQANSFAICDDWRI